MINNFTVSRARGHFSRAPLTAAGFMLFFVCCVLYVPRNKISHLHHTSVSTLLFSPPYWLVLLRFLRCWTSCLGGPWSWSLILVTEPHQLSAGVPFVRIKSAPVWRTPELLHTVSTHRLPLLSAAATAGDIVVQSAYGTNCNVLELILKLTWMHKILRLKSGPDATVYSGTKLGFRSGGSVAL